MGQQSVFGFVDATKEIAMSRRFGIAAVIYMMVNAVLFGIGAVTVLSIPGLSENAKYWLPVVIATSFVLAAPLSWIIAPRLRKRSN